MDSVELRFINFKAFLKLIPNISSTYIQIIDLVSLDQFLGGLKQHYANKPVTELVSEVANKANIDLNTINQETKDKFVRYIQYFKTVSEI